MRPLRIAAIVAVVTAGALLLGGLWVLGVERSPTPLPSRDLSIGPPVGVVIAGLEREVREREAAARRLQLQRAQRAVRAAARVAADARRLARPALAQAHRAAPTVSGTAQTIAFVTPVASTPVSTPPAHSATPPAAPTTSPKPKPKPAPKPKPKPAPKPKPKPAPKPTT